MVVLASRGLFSKGGDNEGQFFLEDTQDNYSPGMFEPLPCSWDGCSDPCWQPAWTVMRCAKSCLGHEPIRQKASSWCPIGLTVCSQLHLAWAHTTPRQNPSEDEVCLPAAITKPAYARPLHDPTSWILSLTLPSTPLLHKASCH